MASTSTLWISIWEIGSTDVGDESIDMVISHIDIDMGYGLMKWDMTVSYRYGIYCAHSGDAVPCLPIIHLALERHRQIRRAGAWPVVGFSAQGCALSAGYAGWRPVCLTTSEASLSRRGHGGGHARGWCIRKHAKNGLSSAENVGTSFQPSTLCLARAAVSPSLAARRSGVRDARPSPRRSWPTTPS